MKTLTPIGIRKQATRFVDSLAGAAYEIDGSVKNIDLFRTSIDDDGTVKVYVYFDDSVSGTMGQIRLIDRDGDVVALADRAFVKPASKGLYVAFKYKFVEMEDDTDVGL
ncbi:hypothetical protein V3851_07540 [Paenibacillus sp. M1]|uniref:Uncharacterized protein n=1 Tax=Paenibacillus haidiansis TaxID=1574488 RepID=A0ABU7VPJ7_9BACL